MIANLGSRGYKYWQLGLTWGKARVSASLRNLGKATAPSGVPLPLDRVPKPPHCALHVHVGFPDPPLGLPMRQHLA